MPYCVFLLLLALVSQSKSFRNNFFSKHTSQRNIIGMNIENDPIKNIANNPAWKILPENGVVIDSEIQNSLEIHNSLFDELMNEPKELNKKNSPVLIREELIERISSCQSNMTFGVGIKTATEQVAQILETFRTDLDAKEYTALQQFLYRLANTNKDIVALHIANQEISTLLVRFKDSVYRQKYERYEESIENKFAKFDGYIENKFPKFIATGEEEEEEEEKPGLEAFLDYLTINNNNKNKQIEAILEILLVNHQCQSINDTTQCLYDTTVILRVMINNLKEIASLFNDVYVNDEVRKIFSEELKKLCTEFSNLFMLNIDNK